MWRSEKKGPLYSGFLKSFESIFTVQSAADYRLHHYLFHGRWTLNQQSLPLILMRKKTQPVKQRVRIPSFHLIDSGKHPSLQPNASNLVKLFTKLLVSTLYFYQVQHQLEFYQQ